MYSSERSPIPVSIFGCINLLVRTVPVPPSLSVVAPVVNAPVAPHSNAVLVLATPFPPNPGVDSLIGAIPRAPTTVLNI